MTFFTEWVGKCDDVIFITSYINDAIRDEIQWPTLQNQLMLGSTIP